MAMLHAVSLALPAPAAIILVVTAIHHLIPIANILPALPLVLANLPSLIPHPNRNLPREFFNLPPREDNEGSFVSTTTSWSSRIGLRGSIILVFVGQACLALTCGWLYIAGHGGDCTLGISVTILPSTVGMFAGFRLVEGNPPSLLLRFLFAKGGINHTTVFRRILPLSMVPSIVAAILTAVYTQDGSIIILTILTAECLAIGILSVLGIRRERSSPRRGAVRLRSQSPSPDMEKYINPEQLHEMTDGSDWLSSPSQVDITPSGFSFSPTPSAISPQTPKPREKSRQITGSPTPSWLSEPESTPSSVACWSYSQSIASPNLAIVHPSSSTSSHATFTSTSSPQSPDKATSLRPNRSNGSIYTVDSTTTFETTRSATFYSPGGSVLGGYEPDPLQPLPRNFDSLYSFPLSARATSESLHRPCRPTNSSLNGVPADSRREDSLCSELESYHSAQETTTARFVNATMRKQSQSQYETPRARRAPPPPPMPIYMPLPPTPSLSQSRTSSPWEGGTKVPSEFLLGNTDWVEVGRDTDGIDSWGQGDRGAGVWAFCGTFICFTLDLPILVKGRTDTTQIILAISIFLPSLFIILASKLLTNSPPKARSFHNGSSKTTATHRSLALCSASELSLPITISPKLTPPGPQRQSTLPATPHNRITKIVKPKPSISNFGYSKPDRRHTSYGAPDTASLECFRLQVAADEAMRRTLARRSGDVWIENGHAREGLGLVARTVEILKPVPALRVLDDDPRQSVLKRLRGGIVSMLPLPRADCTDLSHFDNFDHTAAGLKISITPPSDYDRPRESYMSTSTIERYEDGASSDAEIHMATRARRSYSPPVIISQERKIENDIHTIGELSGTPRPRPLSTEDPTGDQSKFIPSPLKDHPKSHQPANDSDNSSLPRSGSHSFTNDERASCRTIYTHTRGYSSSIDMSLSDYPRASTPHFHKRKTKTKSLPSIDFADFGYHNVEVYDSRNGIDLPPIPPTLQYINMLVDGKDETTIQTSFEADMSIVRNAALARKFLGENDEGAREWSMIEKDSSFIRNVAVAQSLVAQLSLHDESSRASPKIEQGFNTETQRFSTTNESMLAPSTERRQTSYRLDSDSSYGYYSSEINFGLEDDLPHPSPAFHLNTSISGSFVSTDDAAAEEMERVMMLDTPTREEFVISPVMSTVTSKTATSEGEYTDTTTTTSLAASPYVDSERVVGTGPSIDYSVAKLPSLPVNHYSNQGKPMSHPHPPPLTAQSALYVHPLTIPPHPSVRGLLSRQSSSDTLASDSSAEASIGYINNSSRSSPARRTIRDEFVLLKQLREQTTQARSRMTPYEKSNFTTDAKQGIRPLQLVARLSLNRNLEETHSLSQSKTSGHAEHPFVGPAASVGRRSIGAGDKENVRMGKRSKVSTGSGISGIRV